MSTRTVASCAAVRAMGAAVAPCGAPATLWPCLGAWGGLAPLRGRWRPVRHVVGAARRSLPARWRSPWLPPGAPAHHATRVNGEGPAARRDHGAVGAATGFHFAAAALSH